MKVLVILSVMLAFVAAAPSGELDMLHEFDYEGIFNNADQRKVAFDCLLDKAPCGDLQPVKDGVVRTVANKCAECSPEQKDKYKNVLKVFHDRFGPVYDEFMKKYAKE